MTEIVPPPAFAELGAASNFSFLRGASHGEELVVRAAELGLAAIGIADRNSLAGVVRAHVAARDLKNTIAARDLNKTLAMREETIAATGLRYRVGARLVTTDGLELLVWPEDRAAYGRLSSLLTIGNRRAPKGECHLTLDDILAHAEGIWAALVPPEDIGPVTTDTYSSCPASVPGIHVFLRGGIKDVDGRDKPGHDALTKVGGGAGSTLSAPSAKPSVRASAWPPCRICAGRMPSACGVSTASRARPACPCSPPTTC